MLQLKYDPEPLGEGMYSRVWGAVDLELDRRVVVKILLEPYPRETVSHPRAMAKLDDMPGMVPIYFVGEVPSPTSFKEMVPGIVMKHVHGTPASRPLNDEGYTIPQVQDLLGQLVKALSYLHNRGMAHGDPHADNVLVQERDDGSLKLHIIDPGPGSLFTREQDAIAQDVKCAARVLDALIGHSPSLANSVREAVRAELYQCPTMSRLSMMVDALHTEDEVAMLRAALDRYSMQIYRGGTYEHSPIIGFTPVVVKESGFEVFVWATLLVSADLNTVTSTISTVLDEVSTGGLPCAALLFVVPPNDELVEDMKDLFLSAILQRVLDEPRRNELLHVRFYLAHGGAQPRDWFVNGAQWEQRVRQVAG